LQMPEGKSIFISEAVSDMLFDVENTSNIYDRDMGGHVWTMLPAGLACLDCDITEKNSPFTKGNVSREFDYRDFSEIAAAGAFNIEVRHGSEFRITADGSQRFIDHLDIEKDGKRLIIEMRHGINFFVRDKRANVSITLPELSRLKITGANRAVITGFSGDEMDLQVAGASEVDMHSSYKRLTVEVTGASSLVLSGKGNDLDVNVSGASRLKAFGYQTATCNIKVNGASKAEVNVSGQLDADANGASEILYKGLPKISSDVTGFSSIKPSQ
ncbi:MAG TPA: head GIN domain-containing protein, partial [Chitinophagales bacterium]|nr:head GIN domain-containing protein [Chitinophagales bacterium]